MAVCCAAVLGLSSCGSSPSAQVSPPTTEPTPDTLPLGATGPFTAEPVACSGIAVYPSPDTVSASPTTQVSFRGTHSGDITAATVVVTGSLTGEHDGEIVANSDGNGASFFPAEPFAAGETVTVDGPGAICGGDGNSTSFAVGEDEMAALPEDTSDPTDTPTTSADDLQHFVSDPDLQPPVLTVEQADEGDAAGLFFLGAKGGTLDPGVLIVDGAGEPVWFHEASDGTQATDVRVQEYQAEPVITWWEGASHEGNGAGHGVIVNASYETVGTVEAGNGYDADLHEFLVDPDGTAWLTIYATTPGDLTAQGGPGNAPVYNSIVQQIDIATGNVLFEWHSLDHVALDQSAVDYSPEEARPYDYFHVNAVEPSGFGTVLISARNTNAVYLLNQATGEVLWTLGGTDSSFDMGKGAGFVFQHDARMRGDSHVTIFDNETDETPARLLALSLDLDALRAEVTWEHTAPGDIPVRAQGNLQLLEDGNLVSGWGSEATEAERKGTSTITEYTGNGEVVFHARFRGTGINTYRAYRQVWSARPDTSPVATRATVEDREVVAVSWNGATDVVSWELATAEVGGETLATEARAGFETLIPVDDPPSGLVVRALDADGEVLATAPVTITAPGGE